MNKYTVYLDTQPTEVPVTSDNYIDDGTFIRFYKRVDERQATVAIFAKHRIVAVLKRCE